MNASRAGLLVLVPILCGCGAREQLPPAPPVATTSSPIVDVQGAGPAAWEKLDVEIDKACADATGKAAPREELRAGDAEPRTVWGQRRTRKSAPNCFLYSSASSIGGWLTAGRPEQLRGVYEGILAKTPDDVRAVVCVDENTKAVGAYRDERAVTVERVKAYQLVWKVSLLSWPSKRMVARISFSGDIPPEQVALQSATCVAGERPWRALNRWLLPR